MVKNLRSTVSNDLHNDLYQNMSGGTRVTTDAIAKRLLHTKCL